MLITRMGRFLKSAKQKFVHITIFMKAQQRSYRDEYKKLFSLQRLVRTTRRTNFTKTANIIKDYATFASHGQNITVLQK